MGVEPTGGGGGETGFAACERKVRVRLKTTRAAAEAKVEEIEDKTVKKSTGEEGGEKGFESREGWETLRTKRKLVGA